MSGDIYTSVHSSVSKSIEGARFVAKSRSKPLVFISHRQSDSQSAIALANILVNTSEVDVYMESFNPLLASNNPEEVTNAIDFGLNVCTHLVAVLSNATRGSWWVPYEIGVARNRPIPCAIMPLEEVSDLPEYMQTVSILSDNYRLALWLKNLPRYTTKSLDQIDIEIPGLPKVRSSPLRYISD